MIVFIYMINYKLYLINKTLLKGDLLWMKELKIQN